MKKPPASGRFARLRQKAQKLIGAHVETCLDPLAQLLGPIKQYEQRLESLSAEQLTRRSNQLKQRVQAGQDLDTLLPEAFALVCQCVQRTLGVRLFDEQIMAGIALHRGTLVQMQTGEGKTLAAVAPAYLNALEQRGVHILTFNAYLARRDAAWMEPAYSLLGQKVGAVTQDMDLEEHRRAYQADVTYLTAKEAGYDLLRQSIVRSPEDLFRRPYHFAIVDEADSILIDEARVPLIIAGSNPQTNEQSRHTLATVVAQLQESIHYQCDEHRRNVYFTEAGLAEIEKRLNCEDLHKQEQLGVLTRLNQALWAQVLLQRDVDYIVRESQVTIVDEFTGRVVEDRHWPDGLHRAVEAKEHLPHSQQGKVLNSITMQHFLKLYPKLAGMTGTALGAQQECWEFYDLTTVIIPPHKTCIRQDQADLLFVDLESKTNAIMVEVAQAHARGQPVLIGTASVRESQQLAEGVQAAGLACKVLNAVCDEHEAQIIAEAGAPGAITISTNMAGRGTDIRLGGSDESQYQRVVASGGLVVIGTNRHESRRIDNQLRGRAGRQGDPGRSRFFVSLADPLFKTFGLEQLISPHARQHLAGPRPLSEPACHQKLALIQRRIEGQNLDIRLTLWRYTHYLEQKRKAHYQQRHQVLTGTFNSRLAEQRQKEYVALQEQIGPQQLEHVERQIVLHHMDQGWSDYLAFLADIQETIYLNVLGGRDPLQAFLAQAAQEFCHMQQRIEQQSLQTFDELMQQSKAGELDLSRLRGPSCTWTYLTNDNPFEWQINLASPRHIGSAAWTGVLAALFWFIPVLYKLMQWLRQNLQRKPGQPKQ